MDSKGDELDRFVIDMLEAKRLSGVDDNVRAQLVDDLKQELLDQINRALINALPEEKLDELTRMLEDEAIPDDAIQQFMINSGIDVQRVTAQTMLAFKALYLQSEEERGA